MFTTKDIFKNVLTSIKNKKYILYHDKKEKEKENYVPIENIENTNLDADDLFDMENDKKIPFKNIRIKKLNKGPKLGVQP